MDKLRQLATMEAVSRAMLAAAQANDWDRLVALEHDMSHQRKVLEADPGPALATLPADATERAAELIRSIVANDARTREIVVPWLDSVRTLLSRGARKRDLRGSYGAFSQAP